MILDAFSYLTPDHPARGASTFGYVVAPDPTLWSAGDSAMPARVLAEMQTLTPVVGILLPVYDASDDAFLQCLPVPPAKTVRSDTSLSGASHSHVRGLLLACQYDRAARLNSPYTQARLSLAPQMPVVIDAGFEGFSRPADLEPFLQWFYDAFPDRACILTHGGQLNISGGHLSAARQIFQQYPQTILETSGIYRQDFLEEMLQILGASRLIFGSGFPMMEERLELERIRILPVDDASYRAITCDNARRIFGMEQV